MQQHKRLPIRLNFAWTFTGNVVFMLAQWGILVMLTKLTPDKATVGAFTLALAVTAPVVLFFRFNLQSIVASDREDRYLFNDYFAFGLTTSALGFLVVLGIAWSVYETYAAWIICLVGLIKAIEQAAVVVYGLLQQRERMDYSAKLKVAKGIAAFAAFAVTLAVTRSLAWGLIAWFAAWGVLLLTLEIRAAAAFVSTVVPQWNGGAIRRLAIEALPLGIAGGLTSITGNVPKYFVEGEFGLELLGYFGPIAYVTVATTMFMPALSFSILPRLSGYAASGRYREFVLLVGKAAIIGCGAGIAATTFVALMGGTILSWLYTAEYTQYAPVFLVLIAGTIFANVAVFLRAGIIALRAFRLQCALDCMLVLVSISMSWFLIGSHGLMGAAYAITTVRLINMMVAAAILAFLVAARTARSGHIEVASNE